MRNDNSGIKFRRRALDRAWILECAEGLFADRGFANTTMADIAEKTEMGMATLYKFFKGKQELYEALLQDRFGLAWPGLVAAVEGPGSAWERLETYIRVNVALPLQYGHLAKVICRESLGGLMLPKLNPDDPVARLWSRLEAVLTEVCQQLIEERDLDVEAEDLVTFVSGILASFVFRYLETEELHKL
ncbi:MAG: TetR/AcrR family transcriptional regulator, partial [Proteobacteria bacterium]|nr:TetR/AcrR family transcriptional regulator [Pseudomonadota bacterium]